MLRGIGVLLRETSKEVGVSLIVYAIFITAVAGFLLGFITKRKEKKPCVKLGNSKVLKAKENEEYLNFLNYDGTEQS